jgi:hypothetical protein
MRENRISLIGVLVAAALVAGPLVSIPAAAKGGTVSGGGGGGGGGGGSGGGGSGGGSTCDLAAVLPALAPFPDIILRESFGFGPGVRPAGGNGCNKPYLVHDSIAGFWTEFPGSKNTAWLAPADVETWRICASSGDPDELPSPLQPDANSGGCLVSQWTDPVITRPTALVPFTAPASAYQMSIEAWPAPVNADYYLGFGLTDNSVLDSNLETSAGVWLELRADEGATMSAYALRANGRTGPILASGMTPWSANTHLVLRYDPVTQTVSASVEGVELGSFVQPIKTPRFIGIEGVGVVDDLVVRRLP